MKLLLIDEDSVSISGRVSEAWVLTIAVTGSRVRCWVFQYYVCRNKMAREVNTGIAATLNMVRLDDLKLL